MHTLTRYLVLETPFGAQIMLACENKLEFIKKATNESIQILEFLQQNTDENSMNETNECTDSEQKRLKSNEECIKSDVLLKYEKFYPTLVEFEPKTYRLAVALTRKFLVILKWCIESSQWLQENHVIRVEKSLTVLRFSTEADEVVLYYGNKFGDLFKRSLDTPSCLGPLNLFSVIEDDHCPVLGHISMITDCIILDDFIITSDRDEKIRKSSRKAPFIIDQFLLNHTEYISSLCQCSSFLISGGGDSYVSVWDMSNPNHIIFDKKIELSCPLPTVNILRIIAVSGHSFLVIFEDFPIILHYSLSGEILSSFELNDPSCRIIFCDFHASMLTLSYLTENQSTLVSLEISEHSIQLIPDYFGHYNPSKIDYSSVDVLIRPSLLRKHQNE